MDCSSKIELHCQCEKKRTINKIPSVLLISKHLVRKKSYASEAVRTRGDLDTVNQFFKVSANV